VRRGRSSLIEKQSSAKRGDGILCPVPEPEFAAVGVCRQRALELLSADRDAADAPFETVEETEMEEMEVEETTDRAVHPLFETVGETASEIDSTTTAHTELPPPPQESEVYRLEHSMKDTHASVICELTRICRIPELLQETQRVSVAMRQVQLEGWHLANLHILRYFNEGEDVPDLEQMFFSRCCAATLANIESRDRASTAPKDPSFHRICLQYWAGRENETAFTSERVVNANSLISEVAKMMEINARNMVALHFRRRLHQYIRFRYAPQRELQLK
jgi:hypothetical protein